MRQRLREQQQASSWSRLINHILTELERLRSMIQPANISGGDGGSGGSSFVSARPVTSLPPIPTIEEYVDFVYYQGQVWKAREGQTRWYPMDGPTTYSGAPGA